MVREYGNAAQGPGRTAAITAYAEAVQIQPDYAKAHYNLGVVYASQEQYGRAAASNQAALRLDPENPRLLYNLGVVYNRLGRHREAIAAYQRRLRLLTADAEDADAEEDARGSPVRKRRSISWGGNMVLMLLKAKKEKKTAGVHT